MKLNEIKRDKIDIIKECFDWLVEFNPKQNAIPHHDYSRFKSEFDDYFVIHDMGAVLNMSGTALNLQFKGAWRNPPFDANVYNLGIFESDCSNIDLSFLNYARAVQFHDCKIGDTQNLVNQKSKLSGLYMSVNPDMRHITGIANLIDNVPGTLVSLRLTHYHISNRKGNIEVITGAVERKLDDVFELQEWMIDHDLGDIV